MSHVAQGRFERFGSDPMYLCSFIVNVDSPAIRRQPGAGRLKSAPGVFGDAMGQAHDHLHFAARTHNSISQGMPERELIKIRRIEPCGLSDETEPEHYRRLVGIVSKPKDMPNFVYGVEKHYIFRKLETGVERNPSLKTIAVGKLGTRAHADAEVEEGRRSVQELHRTVVSGTHLVPVQIENAAPEIERVFELFRQNPVGGRDSHSEIEIVVAEQVAVAFAGSVFAGPVRGDCGGETCLSEAVRGKALLGKRRNDRKKENQNC
jgi:hypothetical protein